MKILIVEINDDISTVLNDEGEFMDVPTQDGWQCGMELDYEPVKAEKQIQKKDPVR